MREAVYIQWLDHCSMDNAYWTQESEIKAMKPVVVDTLGFVLTETKEYVVLVSSMNTSDTVAGDILILKSCIVKRKKLNVK